MTKVEGVARRRDGSGIIGGRDVIDSAVLIDVCWPPEIGRTHVFHSIHGIRVREVVGVVAGIGWVEERYREAKSMDGGTGRHGCARMLERCCVRWRVLCLCSEG